MKIALLGPANSIHLLSWANALSRRDIEVHVISQQEARSGFDVTVRQHRLPLTGKAGYYMNAVALAAVLRAEKPDLLHVHYASGYGTLGRLSHFSPYLLSVWGSDIYLFPRKGAISKQIIKRNLRSPARILSTSFHMADETRALCGREVEVTPFGIDLEMFRPGVRRNAKIVGTVRGLEEIYGIDILINAFALVLREPEGRDASLLIVGDGPQRQELEALATSLGIRERVEFRGRIAHDDVPAAMSDMQVFAALSRSESFCVAALEAEACGVPVVATRVGGIPEVVIDGTTGILVSPDDPQAAAKAILHLLANEELSSNMRAAGPLFVASNYRQSDCVDRMVAIYEQTLADTRKAARR